MKNIERGLIKYLILLILWTAIVGLVLFPLFDMLSACTNKNNFVYSIGEHIVLPVIFAIVYGITFWAFDKRKK